MENPQLGERLFCVLNDLYQRTECSKEGCHNYVNFKYLKEGYSKYCSYACSANSILTKKLRKKTVIDKYGVDNISKLESTKNKKIQTTLKNFNVKHPMQSQDVMKKSMASNFAKNGYFGNKPKEEILKTVENYNKVNERKDQTIFFDFEKKKYSISCVKCGISSILHTQSFLYIRLFCQKSNICPICNPLRKNVSNAEINFESFIKEIYDGTLVRNDRTVLKGKEIDFLFEELNVGIELNGLYWHSDKFHKKSQDAEKITKCKEKGVFLFQFFEDEFIKALRFVFELLRKHKSLKPHLKINEINAKYGLNLDLCDYSFEKKFFFKTIETKVGISFLNEYHKDNNREYGNKYYGMFDSDESLISVFSINEEKRKRILEIREFANRPFLDEDWSLKQFVEHIKPEGFEIKALSKNRFQESRFFEKTGFYRTGETMLNFSYYFKGRRIERSKFSKKILFSEILPKYNIPTMSYSIESQAKMIKRLIANGHSVNKTYDCGSEIFSYRY